MPRHRQRKTTDERNRKEPWTFGNLLCVRAVRWGSFFKVLVCPGFLLFCSLSEALEQAPGADSRQQAKAQLKSCFIQTALPDSWVDVLSLSLSPGNSYSLISSWNTPQNLPNMVASTLCFHQTLSFSSKAGSMCHCWVSWVSKRESGTWYVCSLHVEGKPS